MSDMTDDQVMDWLQDTTWDQQQQQEAQRRDEDELRKIRQQRELEQIAFDHGIADPEHAAMIAKAMPKLIDAMADFFLAGYEAAIKDIQREFKNGNHRRS